MLLWQYSCAYSGDAGFGSRLAGPGKRLGAMSDETSAAGGAQALEIRGRLAAAGAPKSLSKSLMGMWLRGYMDQCESPACNGIFCLQIKAHTCRLWHLHSCSDCADRGKRPCLASRGAALASEIGLDQLIAVVRLREEKKDHSQHPT